MNDKETLEQVLETAQLVLGVLEKQAAGYTELTIPANLVVELEAQRKKVTSLEDRLKQLQGFKLDSIPNNLPRLANIFVGRKTEIKRCMDALVPEERGWGISIDGLGGIGKTTLAVEVAHRAYRQAWFDAYLYVSAKTTWLGINGINKETLTFFSLNAFCQEFMRLLNEHSDVQTIDNVKQRDTLLSALQGRRTLLIWDNLEALSHEEHNLIAEFLRRLPAPNKAIVTSRRRLNESALTVRLDDLSESDAFELMFEFGRRHPRVSRELTEAGIAFQKSLYGTVGGNPLALNWTLGLIAHKGYTSENILDLLKDAERSKDLYKFIFDKATQDLSKVNEKVLISLSSFAETATLDQIVSSSGITVLEVREALEQLATLSLVDDLEVGLYSLHPLTKTYVSISSSMKESSKSIVKPLTYNPVTYNSDSVIIQNSSKFPRRAEVEIKISNPRNPIETIIPITAILDTGADMTMIPNRVIESLGDLISGEVRVRSVNRDSVWKTYIVDIELDLYKFYHLEVVGIDRQNGIVGRDILNHFEWTFKPI